MVWYGVVWYGTVRYSMIWYGNIVRIILTRKVTGVIYDTYMT